MPDDVDLITVPELGRRFGLGKDAAYRLANTPGFPVIRYGKKILVIRHLLPQWLESNQGRAFEAEPMPAGVRSALSSRAASTN